MYIQCVPQQQLFLLWNRSALKTYELAIILLTYHNMIYNDILIFTQTLSLNSLSQLHTYNFLRITKSAIVKYLKTHERMTDLRKPEQQSHLFAVQVTLISQVPQLDENGLLFSIESMFYFDHFLRPCVVRAQGTNSVMNSANAFDEIQTSVL